MDFTELVNEIEIEIPKHAQANYQYVVIRYLLLVKSAKKSDVIESLQKYNQNKENNDYQSVFDTLQNSKFNIIEKNKNITLSNTNDLSDKKIYDLVLKCEKNIQKMINDGFGTTPTEKYMTFKDAAKRILKEKNFPMNYTDITNIALAKNLIKTEGETPNFTLFTKLITDIKNNGKDSEFLKTGESTFFINYKFTVIESKEELKKVEERFIEKLNQNTTKSGKIRINVKKGSFDRIAGWIPDYGFWWATSDDQNKDHYWNAFGLEEPKWNTNANHKMWVQVNPPIKDRDRTTGGTFLKDVNGEYYVAHNGKVGGGSEGVGKWNFQNFMYYSDRWIEVIDSDKKPEELLLVTKIDDENFFKNIREYIDKAYEFKHIENKEKFSINPEKFKILHEKFLEKIYKESIKKGHSNEESHFKNFSNKYLVNKEIIFKNQVYENARKVLEFDKWVEFLNKPGTIVGKIKNVCDQKVCQKLLSPPKNGIENGQAGMLYKLSDKQIPEFEKIIYKFCVESNEDKFAKSFDDLILFLKENKLPVNSQFMAYLSFLKNKELYVPIRIMDFQKIMIYYDIIEKSTSKFSWKEYKQILDLLESLKSKLEEQYPRPNTVEVHSYLWEIVNIDMRITNTKNNTLPVNIQNHKNGEFSEYFKILENKNQFIFYGPPGTGKTYKAKKIAQAFIEGSKVYEIPEEPDYSKYVEDSLKKLSISNSFDLDNFGNNKFLIKNPDGEKARGKLIFINSGKSEPNKCSVTIDEDTIDFLSGIDKGRRYIIVVNSETRNFVVIPHQMIIDKFLLSLDKMGKTEHRFIIKISRDHAEFLYSDERGEQFQKCTRLLHNFEIMFDKSILPCQFFEKVTFHQSFSYEEFLEGIRPEVSVDNKFITYPVKPGIFKKICACASADEKQRYVLLIDEINRGNISKIFGELITLIEKDKRGSKNALRLPYSKEMFDVPPNLYIIGTMNTADRSLVKLDVALRRRFAFVELMPKSSELDDNKISGISVRKILDKINQRIKDKGRREYQIGHAYFMPDGKTVDSISQLQYIFAYEIIPLLREYFFDNDEKLKEILKEQFIDWENMTVKDDWQKNEGDFLQNLEEFMK